MDNKNKLTRIFQPSMRLYFILLVVFAAVTMFFDRALACAEVGVIILLYIYSRFSNNRRRSQIVEYIEDMADSVNSATKDTLVNFPLPMVIFNLEDGKLVWSNDEFLFMTGDREHFFEMHLKDFLGEFNYKWIVEGKKMAPDLLELHEREYRVYGNLVRKENESQREFFGVLYFADVTEYENIRREYGDSRPIVSTLMLDNYDELFKSLTDTSKSQLMSVIDDKIGVWSQDCNGILFKYDRDKYIFIFEERYLPEFVNEKFSVLDTVHDIVNPSGIHATVSIGVGKDGDTLAESFRFAELATDMALSRGGDQAVIKNKFNFEFYGGHSKTLEKGTKVKSRVMANAFGELISDASQIFVMGHKYADLDTVGAAVGISCISRKRMKKCYIVIDMDNNASKELVDRITTLPEYEDTFISSQDAMLRADGKSLLVVVDTNRPDQVESKELLMSCNKVVVIDHHRRASDYISDAALNIHEPYASSASELVSEMLQYLVEQSDILKLEAEALMSGIVLDTKNFTMRTGSRTFEAAAFLRRSGSDTAEVKRMMQNDFSSTIARYNIVKEARVYRDDIAIAAVDTQEDRIVAAQAADELLNIAGISASFVVFHEKNSINISARSIGHINVQLVLEKLGGGGNQATAGAQLQNKTYKEVLAALLNAIDSYIEEEE